MDHLKQVHCHVNANLGIDELANLVCEYSLSHKLSFSTNKIQKHKQVSSIQNYAPLKLSIRDVWGIVCDYYRSLTFDELFQTQVPLLPKINDTNTTSGIGKVLKTFETQVQEAQNDGAAMADDSNLTIIHPHSINTNTNKASFVMFYRYGQVDFPVLNLGIKTSDPNIDITHIIESITFLVGYNCIQTLYKHSLQVMLLFYKYMYKRKPIPANTVVVFQIPLMFDFFIGKSPVSFSDLPYNQCKINVNLERDFIVDHIHIQARVGAQIHNRISDNYSFPIHQTQTERHVISDDKLVFHNCFSLPIQCLYICFLNPRGELIKTPSLSRFHLRLGYRDNSNSNVETHIVNINKTQLDLSCMCSEVPGYYFINFSSDHPMTTYNGYVNFSKVPTAVFDLVFNKSMDQSTCIVHGLALNIMMIGHGAGEVRYV